MFEALFSFLFKFPARVYERGDFTFVPILAPLVLLAIALALLAAVAYLHSRLSTVSVRDRVILG